jgi:hypothetical protein
MAKPETAKTITELLTLPRDWLKQALARMLSRRQIASSRIVNWQGASRKSTPSFRRSDYWRRRPSGCARPPRTGLYGIRMNNLEGSSPPPIRREFLWPFIANPYRDIPLRTIWQSLRCRLVVPTTLRRLSAIHFRWPCFPNLAPQR